MPGLKTVFLREMPNTILMLLITTALKMALSETPKFLIPLATTVMP